MKASTILLLLSSAILMSGCGPTEQEAKFYTKNSLRTPQFVGNLPDGRKIQYVKISHEGTSYKHYVYFVGDDVTVNRSVPSGKTTRNDVVVFLQSQGIVDKEEIENSKLYQAVKREEDEAEYERLKAELGK